MKRLTAVVISILLLMSVVTFPSLVPLSTSQAQAPEPQIDPEPAPASASAEVEIPAITDDSAYGYIRRHPDRMPKDVLTNNKYKVMCQEWNIEPYTDRCIAEIMKRSIDKQR